VGPFGLAIEAVGGAEDYAAVRADFVEEECGVEGHGIDRGACGGCGVVRGDDE